MEFASESGARPPEARAGYRYFRRRAESLDLRVLLAVTASLAALTLLIAAGFALVGAWLIVPFAGLEVAALGVAAAAMARRAGDFERLAVDGDRILVEVRELGRTRRYTLHRAWVRLDRSADGIALRSHGRTVSIGRFCGEDGRRMLARELRSRVGGPGY